MYIAFPADEKVKARLDSVCKSLGITYEEWFETALIESEHDVLTEVLSGDESEWMWDANLCRFVRRTDAEYVSFCWRNLKTYEELFMEVGNDKYVLL